MNTLNVLFYYEAVQIQVARRGCKDFTCEDTENLTEHGFGQPILAEPA